MNFCACGVVSIRCSLRLFAGRVRAYLDVLDGNTTHFVGIAGDTEG
jgi:hypothetical protein